MTNIQLKRTISLPLLILYGLGTVIGAGIYVLLAPLSQIAGYFTPSAFVVASLIALFTGLSYSELSARFPKSAGTPLYVLNAFQHVGLSRIALGLLVFTGIVSSATMARGFVGYFWQFLHLPLGLVCLGLITVLLLITCWGINLSAWVVAVITCLEVTGLALIIWLGYSYGDSQLGEAITWLPASWADTQLVMLGGFIAFYAFIGFEDMVNLAEEVKEPHRTMPIALIVTIVLALVFYLAVSVAVLYCLPLKTIQQSSAPLAQVLIAAQLDPKLISGISMLAVVNGIMVQIIMASRALYGMAKQDIIPSYFAYVNPHTKTPTRSLIIVCLCIFLFSAIIPIKTLASLTSFTMLVLFCLVNLSLIKLKHLDPNTPTLNLPIWVPYTGFVLCFMLASFEIIKQLSLPIS